MTGCQKHVYAKIVVKFIMNVRLKGFSSFLKKIAAIHLTVIFYNLSFFEVKSQTLKIFSENALQFN